MADKKLPRSILLKSVDAGLLFGGAFLFGTGLALEYRLPRGSGGHGLEILGLGRHDWGALHWWVGVVMGLLVCVHLLLHWKWIKRAIVSENWKLGFLVIALSLLLFLFPLLIPVSSN